MKYAMPSRREMGIRTIFNLLGPLTNPASASIQLMGVYRAELTEVMAQVLLELGTEKALIVYGADGLDELSTTGVNKLTELNSGKITTYYLDPRELGIARPELAQLGGGSPSENARIVRAVLGGERGPKRQIVELNAAAGLKVAGAVADFNQGLSLSAEVIDSGRAQEKLAQLIQFSQSHHNAQSG
jgi:anthranilate phosphoribosyltransferase